MKPPFYILLVEDNPAHAELVMRTFEMRRDVESRIAHVPDGEMALDYLMRRGEYADPERSPRPNVIFLDLRLPRIDGLEVLREIKSQESLCKIPVVVLTTSGAERDVQRAYEHHANSYIVKPVDFGQFSSLIEDLSSYWIRWNFYPWAREG